MPLNIAVLLSGSGSNLQSIIDKIEQGVLDARIRLVLSNKNGVYGLERAEKHGLPTKVVKHTAYDSREDFDAALVQLIRESGAEAVILAGFMRILTPHFINSFPDKILNIHPAVLPCFPGVNGQQQAVDYGVKISGCSVHFVDEKMDHGPVVIQAAVPGLHRDDAKTLGARILKMEHRIFPQAIQWLAQGRLSIEGRKVDVKDCPAPMVINSQEDSALVNPGLENGF
ncbi:phosphoribosylglycinamide formyltransferase [Desulfonatronovibrio magnus]|uniref:phosphoribosylglycinamide formyltransferase n=1 Tax=Desulfonatronovibrio magnus TaxID=698827 RepID=UPI0005EACB4C|nr:phosphoribosylglycinamide formyltransferase [Desulfonatronovibrio magnus]